MIRFERLFDTTLKYASFTMGVFAVGTAVELLGPESLDWVGLIGASGILGTTAFSIARRASPLRPPDLIE